MTERSVAQLVIDGLRSVDIDTLFCLPGIQNDDFFDALVDARDIRPIVARHEQGAAYMALGASQVTGRPAAFCVVPGPGVLNASAAMNSAYWSGGRVLGIIGAIPSSLEGKATGVLHDLPDPTGLLGHLTKSALYVSSGDDAAERLQTALDSLVAGLARPVSLQVPVDVWRQPIEGRLRPSGGDALVDPEQIEFAVDAIDGAERPLIVVGGGAHDASAEVRALAERIGAPVTTRRQGHGVVDSRHPLWVPLPVGRQFWGDADVVIGIGTRLEFPLLHWGTAGLTIVQINHESSELDRHGLGTIGVEGDASVAVAAILDGLRDAERVDRTDLIEQRRAEFAADIAHLEPQLTILRAIRDVLPDDGVIVEDVTQLMFAAHLAFEFRHPRSFLTTGPAGALGAAVAQAVGAQAAVPDRKVLCVAGDGGFMFTASELASAVQHEIPVTVLLHDNQAFGNVRRIQRNRFGPDRTIASDLVNPDFVAFGEAMGVHTERVEDVGSSDLAEKLSRALAHDGPSMVVLATGDVPDPWPYLRMGPIR